MKNGANDFVMAKESTDQVGVGALLKESAQGFVNDEGLRFCCVTCSRIMDWRRGRRAREGKGFT